MPTPDDIDRDLARLAHRPGTPERVAAEDRARRPAANARRRSAGPTQEQRNRIGRARIALGQTLERGARRGELRDA